MSAEKKEAGPPRRWRLRIGLATTALVLLVWAAPMIVASTPLVSWLAARADSYITGSVHVGNASLGWFSPIVLRDVEIRDPEGRPLLQVPRVEGDRWLVTLLWDRDDLGSFRFDSPTVDVTFGDSDSNLETVLEKSLRPPANPEPADNSTPTTLPKMRMEIVNGTLRVHDVRTADIWVVRSLAVNARLTHEETNTIHANVDGLTHDGTEAGTVHVEARLDNVCTPELKSTIKGRFTSLPLGLANALVRRYLPDTQLGGSLQGNGILTTATKDGKVVADFTGDIVVNHARLSTPALADPLYVERLRVPCGLGIDGQKIIARRVELDSEFGTLALRGVHDFAADGRAMFAQPDFDLVMDLNLAKLAERLPKTLALRPGTSLIAGQLNVQVKSYAQNGSTVWKGSLRTSDVRGLVGQQMLDWTEPISVDFQARHLHEGVPAIDRLKCSSRFLQVDASTTQDRFTLNADADLQKLAQPLGQFIDLSGVKLAGKASAAIEVRRVDKEHFNADGTIQLGRMHVTGLTHAPWQEDLASAKFTARGRIDRQGRHSIDAADAIVTLADDRMAIQLKQPIADVATGPWSSYAVRIEGELNRWHTRLRSGTTLFDDWQFAGRADAQAVLRATPTALECASFDVVVGDCRCFGAGLRIHEPTLRLQSAGRWDLKSGNLDVTQIKLTSPTVLIDDGALFWRPATTTWRAFAHFAGDVARLRQWTLAPGAKAPEPMSGAFVGRVELQARTERIDTNFDLAVKNLVYGQPANPTWREPEVKCVGRGVYDRRRDALQLERIVLAVATLGADGHGRIANLTTTCDLELAGVLAYDLEKLEPQLRPLLGKDVKVVGKDARAFKLAGPLYPKTSAGTEPILRFTELQGQANASWKSLRTHGCDVGPVEVKAIIQQGWLQLYPLETTLNGGNLRLQPNLRLDPNPVELVVLAGPVIEKAKITPQMCAGALGYAMPALANVTEAEGTISVTLEAARLPLAAPTTGDVKGTIVLHHAKVGPNAIVRELSALLKLPPAGFEIKECKVPFQMANGKVYHSNLELAFADFTLKSSGAIAMDGSLALVVEMPIPGRLAAALKLTPAQAKQMLRIPIGGTLERPRVDPRALESLTGVLGRSLLENQLDRLLQPKR